MDPAAPAALIFGATGALGGLVVGSLAEQGVRLACSGRRADALALLPGSSLSLPADIRDQRQVQSVVDAAVAQLGGLDIVVNAAGVVAFAPVSEFDSDVTEELFLTNTFGAMFVAEAALRHMNEGGVIASISGVIAEQNMPGMATYGASKAALRSFNEALAREARRSKVRVLDVRPPHTETGLATRPIAGVAPTMPEGLAASHVANVIVHALLDPGVKDLPASAFAVAS